MSDELYAVPKSKLDAIADAINSKRDTVGGMEIDDMPLQIGLIDGTNSEDEFKLVYSEKLEETTNNVTVYVDDCNEVFILAYNDNGSIYSGSCNISIGVYRDDGSSIASTTYFNGTFHRVTVFSDSTIQNSYMTTYGTKYNNSGGVYVGFPVNVNDVLLNKAKISRVYFGTSVSAYLTVGTTIKVFAR